MVGVGSGWGRVGLGGVRLDVNEELIFLWKLKKWWVGVRYGVCGGLGGCERNVGGRG